MKGERPTRATIRLDAVRANFAEARRLAGGRDVIAVVKADGYGHGARPVVRALTEAGCRRLATLTVAEAVELRSDGVALPILVMGGVHDREEAAAAAAAGLTPVVHHAGHVELLTGAAVAAPVEQGRSAPLRVHVEVDTAMRRMGVPPDEAPALLAAVAGAPDLALEGVYTHLACAEEEDLAPSREQLARFRDVLARARAQGARPAVVHCANSGGLLASAALAGGLPEENAVRPGLMLYGVRPSLHLAANLVPVMTFRTAVVAVRRARRGEAVGYSATWRAPRDTRIATLAAGYADGVPVAASGRGVVLLRGRRFPIAGRVSMDFTGVDVGDEPVAVGEEAVIFGEGLPVEEAARAADTIPYELLVRVGGRVPRVVVDP